MTKQELIDAILAASTEQLADVPPLVRHPPRAKRSSKGAKQSTDESITPHDSPEAFALDKAECISGNNSPLIMQRIQATLAMLVKKKQMTQRDADDELADITAQAKAIS